MLWLICLSAQAIDGDTLRCADGVRIRVAGIEANEMRGGCHLPVCPTISGPDGKLWMERQVGGKDLRYSPVGKTWKRISAIVRLPSGQDLSCAAIRAGVAVRWERYDREGRLLRCPTD